MEACRLPLTVRVFCVPAAPITTSNYTFFKGFYYLFLEGTREETEGEKYQRVVASDTHPHWDLARNPGTCPDWESNCRPFGLQAGAQSTEPHQPGNYTFFNWLSLFKK